MPRDARREARRPTVYDVARHAGVSTATVSFAFRQPHRVRPATLELVLEAARVLGYVPSASARGLAGGRTGAIGLYSFDYLLDHRVEPAVSGESAGGDGGYRSFPLYADEVLHGVELECRRRGFALMVGGGRTSPSVPAVVDVAGRVDGLVALAGSLSADVLAGLTQRLPVVLLGARADDARVRTVAVDNLGGMRRLVEHLVGAHGCRRVVFLGEPQTVEIEDRYRGCVEALAAVGVAAPPPTSSYPGLDGTTEQAVRACVERGTLPDAFVCATDQEALVTLDTLASVGVSVPGEVVVTGFDGIVAGRLSTPMLTTVRQPMGEIGRTAVRILVRMLEEGPEQVRSEELPVELVIRASCGCPGTAPR